MVDRFLVTINHLTGMDSYKYPKREESNSQGFLLDVSEEHHKININHDSWQR